MTILIVLVVVVLPCCFRRSLQRSRSQKEFVDNGWSQIDVQLKRRLDLIPNLVETVKGYAEHEREALEAVIAARNGAVAAPDTPGAQAAAEGPIAGALRQLFAVSEAYPDLKANTTSSRSKRNSAQQRVALRMLASSTTMLCSAITTQSIKCRESSLRRCSHSITVSTSTLAPRQTRFHRSVFKIPCTN